MKIKTGPRTGDIDCFSSDLIKPCHFYGSEKEGGIDGKQEERTGSTRNIIGNNHKRDQGPDNKTG
jgi:hypothetical protein